MFFVNLIFERNNRNIMNIFYSQHFGCYVCSIEHSEPERFNSDQTGQLYDDIQTDQRTRAYARTHTHTHTHARQAVEQSARRASEHKGATRVDKALLTVGVWTPFSLGVISANDRPKLDAQMRPHRGHATAEVGSGFLSLRALRFWSRSYRRLSSKI